MMVMDQFLEIAALVSAGVIFALLFCLVVVRVTGGRMPRQAQILRFRRSLKRLDAVTARWAVEMQAPPARGPGEMVYDPRRHQRRPGAES